MVAQNKYQAQYSALDLVVGTQPTGPEVAEFVQGGMSVGLSISQIFAAIKALVLPVPTIRFPAVAATVNVLTSDIEVGVNTAVSAVNVNLPSAAAWAVAFPGGATGLELIILDSSGTAAAHHITFTLNGADGFLQGIAPIISNNFGSLRMRPFGLPVTGWYIKSLG